MEAVAPDRAAIAQHGKRLEYFSIAWNTVEGLLSVLAGVFAGSIALVGFGIDSFIETGGTARVAFAALPGRSFQGKVTLVGREVEPDSRTVPVRIEIKNRDGLLRPGMSATAWLTVGQESGTVLAVPAAALHPAAGNQSAVLQAV